MKEATASMIENEPILKDDDRFDLSRPEARERTMAKVCNLQFLNFEPM
jgi:hypothetical protein